MNHCEIRIAPKGEVTPLYPEHGDAKSGHLIGVAILEGATAQGKTGVGLIVKDLDGKKVLAQLTAEMFLTIGGAVKGAMARFGQPWDGV